RDAGLVGRTVRDIHVHWPRSLALPDVAQFRRILRGRRIEDITRRAKYVVFQLDGGWWLIVHLRMTGRFAVCTPDTPRDSHEHVVLLLDDGRQVRFHDTRKFGRWSLVRNPADVLGKLGPEPLARSFTAEALQRALGSHARMLKPLLLDQTVLAGLGNIYVDEALWEARLHPCRSSTTLTPDEYRRLHAAIRTVLRRGLANMGTTLGNGETNFYSVGRRAGRNADGLRVFRRTGMACPRCGAAIVRLVVGQRSTHVCLSCQRA
ncbi:MAG: DNA-formamidopyrimidine glycosylase, partial [Chitinivibrionales bacterium]|nr:DNA-formamidopyrimidine glycosylase [Chitinivibrionales bacterium]